MSLYNEVGNRAIKPATLVNGTTNRGPTAGIFCGSGGTIVVELVGDVDGDTTTFTNCGPGQWLPLSIKKWVSGPADAVLIAI